MVRFSIYVYLYLLVVNLLLFAMMGIDKSKAKNHKWRIPEAHLFFVGLIGGGFGGFLGMKAFRHKTQKPMFYIVYIIGMLVDVFVLYKFM